MSQKNKTRWIPNRGFALASTTALLLMSMWATNAQAQDAAPPDPPAPAPKTEATDARIDLGAVEGGSVEAEEIAGEAFEPVEPVEPVPNRAPVREKIVRRPVWSIVSSQY